MSCITSRQLPLRNKLPRACFEFAKVEIRSLSSVYKVKVTIYCNILLLLASCSGSASTYHDNQIRVQVGETESIASLAEHEVEIIWETQ